MPDKAVISHRGEKYEIGRGKRFYGIWPVGAPYEAPVDRWPENHDGWQQAWSRFAAIEAPGTIAPVSRHRRFAWNRVQWRKGPRLKTRSAGMLMAGLGLVISGVVLGLIGLFPGYYGGQSLLSQSDQVVSHLIYVIGWAVSAGLIALSVARPGSGRLGALLALGLSAVTFGLFLTDIGEVTAGASVGLGLIVSLVGWLACTVGAGLALAAEWRDPDGRASRPVKPGRGHAGPVTLLVLAAAGTVASFAPSWDRYVLTSAVEGTTQTATAGNAFDNPALVIAGNVVVMVAVVGVALLAALWRPPRQGALLLAGAVLALAAEVVSALIQVSQPVSPAMFAISNAQASALGLTISSGVTPIFWVFLVFVIALLVSCAWLFTEPTHPAMPGMPSGPWLPAGPDGVGAARRAGGGIADDTTRDDDTSGYEGTRPGAGTVSGEGTVFGEEAAGADEEGFFREDARQGGGAVLAGQADSGAEILDSHPAEARDSRHLAGGG